MKVIIAPQGFKGGISGLEAARAIQRGVNAALPEAETVLVPVADGGDGTLHALVDATGGQIFNSRVQGPLGLPLDAAWGVMGDGETAVIARLFTHEAGVGAAYVAGGRGRQLRPVVIPGNVVSAEIRAKSDSQLPFARLELSVSRGPWLSEPLPSAAIAWACAVTAACGCSSATPLRTAPGTTPPRRATTTSM